VKIAKLQQDRDTIDKARIRAEQKAANAREKAERLAKELEFLQDINKSLVSNQEEWKTKIEHQLRDDSKEKKIQDLEEQLRDMMFFIEAQKTVQGSGELQDGSVVVVPNSNPSASTPPKKGKTKPKKK
jgi:BRCA1-associated protein